MAKPWFKPKSYGYGATPASWEGWLSVGIFGVALVADTALTPHLFASAVIGRAAALAGAAVLVAALFALINRKGEGLWRWRWGRDD